jgi:Flp pilus assembly protein TadG
MSSRTCLGIVRRLLDLHRDRRGNVTVMMGFLLPPLIGTFGLGFEVANWYLTTRSMQNAADSAAIAAATNGTSSYAAEAKAVAAQYGFTNNVNNVTVTASNTATCPGGGNTCYSVRITQTVPLFLSQVIGYPGNVTHTQTNAQQQTVTVYDQKQKLTSTSVATQSSISVPLCLLALGKSGAQDIVTNGNPKANMTNCSVMANTSATCNGSNLAAPYGLAHGTDNGCGVIQVSGVPQVADPYSALASNIPSNALSQCGGNFPQEDKQGNGGTQWTSSTWPPASAHSLPNNVYVVCGDQVLNQDVTVTTSPGAVLIVENGQLDLAGHTLQTAANAGLTIVFSGSSGSYTHIPTSSANNKGLLDIAAPTSGPWSGMAIYQDPSLTSGVDMSSAGSGPGWKISGAVYMPDSNVTISGTIDKATNGSNCFVMVMDQITINGTGDILSGDTATGCTAAGLSTPGASVPTRGQLVN